MAGGGDYGEVRVPGGAEAVSFWERLVDASPSDPGRFVERLFARSSGRVAQDYHMVSRLPERQQRFVLGSWLSRRWAAGTRHAGSWAPGGALLGERRPWVR